MLCPRPPKIDEMPMFAPAGELHEFLHKTIFNKKHKYFNKDHKHLFELEFHELAFMWAEGGFDKSGKHVIGECEKVQFMAGGWKKERQRMWFRMILGDIPEYLITLDARYCRDCTDLELRALLEHELYHIVQKTDIYGDLAFKANGRPSLEIIAHDVEEFNGVVRRYGADEEVRKLVDTARKGPLFYE